jgi:uncharacterized DUF497 family protein
MNERRFQFEWDEIKASTNVRKHGVSFEMAATVFYDPGIRTIPDVEHSDVEERWFSIGLASNRTLLSIAYVWARAVFGDDQDPSHLCPKSHSARGEVL